MAKGHPPNHGQGKVMCGLAGEMQFDGPAGAEKVAAMLACLHPRGPDGEGLWLHDNVCLGHRRLKIIDLGERGSQPMVDSELGLTLVFNGCIYNYRPLRRDLEAKGYRFFSTSDSEVIIKAFHAWGKACVHRFQGMFAFAIHQRDSGKLLLARDRLGIKPLYYTLDGNRLLFASTLPALLRTGGLDTTLDPVAINHYLSFRAMVESETPFRHIHKLPPAHLFEISDRGEQSMEHYWQPDFTRDDQQSRFSEADWTDAVQEALFTAVKRRLVADVPVGVLLSGGLDSSLLVGILNELGQKGLNTFSIGFDQVADEAGDEFRYSDLIADHYQTRHHKIFASHERLQDHLQACVSSMSEPMVSHDVIGFYLLSKEVSRHVKVVQSGQGADEVFGGYHWYPPLLEATSETAAPTYCDAYFSWSAAQLEQLLQNPGAPTDAARRYVADFFAASPAPTPIDKALHLDTVSMLVDDPVKRVDNMTMAWGLEARVPFLDHELVELAAKIPAELKLRDGGKYILKQVARRLIPHEVIDRPKGYFPVPALRNMQGSYRELAVGILTSDRARSRGLFDPGYIDRMLAAPEEYRSKFGSRLWQVTLLEYWLQQQGL